MNKEKPNMLSEKSEANVEQIAENLASTIRDVFKKAIGELARGTGTHDEAAAEAVRRAKSPTPPRGVKVAQEPTPAPEVQKSEPKKPISFRAKVETALRKGSLDQQQLAREVDASAGRISEMMKALRAENIVANVGTDVHPIWTWRVGNETSTSELTETVRRLLSERPYTTRELSEVTGATYSRCGGAVVALQRDAKTRIVDLGGHGNACRWFILHPDVRDAHLDPKKPKKPKTN